MCEKCITMQSSKVCVSKGECILLSKVHRCGGAYLYRCANEHECVSMWEQGTSIDNMQGVYRCVSNVCVSMCEQGMCYDVGARCIEWAKYVYRHDSKVCVVVWARYVYRCVSNACVVVWERYVLQLGSKVCEKSICVRANYVYRYYTRWVYSFISKVHRCGGDIFVSMCEWAMCVYQ